MLQAALVVDIPLLHHRVPGVAEALAVDRDAGPGRSVQPLFMSGKAVAAQRQSPFPAAGVGAGQEAAAVEGDAPLLARVPGQMPARHRLEGVAPGLVGGPDVGPVASAEAVGHGRGRRLVGSADAVGRGRRQRGGEAEGGCQAQ